MQVMNLVKISIFSFSLWALATGWEPEVNYERLVWAALALWLSTLWVWIAVRGRLRSFATPLMKRLSRLVDIMIALAPGAILIAYGSIAPAAPSLTRGGFDVCDTSPGWCVSGTRAFVAFGIFTILLGLIAHWIVGLEAPKKDTEGEVS